jgi:hypothetical protein
MGSSAIAGERQRCLRGRRLLGSSGIPPPPRAHARLHPQGINRLGIVFQQLAVAAGTVSIVITLEVRRPPFAPRPG